MDERTLLRLRISPSISAFLTASSVLASSAASIWRAKPNRSMRPSRRPCCRCAEANGGASSLASQRKRGQSGSSQTYIFTSIYDANMGGSHHAARENASPRCHIRYPEAAAPELPSAPLPRSPRMDDMTGLSHASLLDRLAEVAVHVGLGGLNPGQQVVMTAPLDAVALVRRVTEHAYRAGASLVTTFFADDAASLLRYRHAPDAGFDIAAGWLYEGMAAAFRGGAARLAILGDDPNLLA